MRAISFVLQYFFTLRETNQALRSKYIMGCLSIMITHIHLFCNCYMGWDWRWFNLCLFYGQCRKYRTQVLIVRIVLIDISVTSALICLITVWVTTMRTSALVSKECSRPESNQGPDSVNTYRVMSYLMGNGTESKFLCVSINADIFDFIKS